MAGCICSPVEGPRRKYYSYQTDRLDESAWFPGPFGGPFASPPVICRLSPCRAHATERPKERILIEGGCASAASTNYVEIHMVPTQKDKLLRFSLTAFGIIFCLVYPVGLIWPSGWVWHGGQGQYYLQMICGIYAVLGIFLIGAARNPSRHASLISFTIWSSLVHAGIMAAQAIHDGHELGHLAGDVPALILVAAVLWLLRPAPVGVRGAESRQKWNAIPS